MCDCQNADCNTILEMKKNISTYISGCLVLCFKQSCCGSVTWIMDKKCPGFEKCWYCTEVLKKKKQIKCSVLVCVYGMFSVVNIFLYSSVIFIGHLFEFVKHSVTNYGNLLQ